MFITTLAENSTCVRLSLHEMASTASVLASLSAFAASQQQVPVRLVGLDEVEGTVTVRFSAVRSHPVVVRFLMAAVALAPRVVVAPRDEEWSAAMAYLSALPDGHSAAVLRDEHDLAFYKFEQERAAPQRRAS